MTGQWIDSRCSGGPIYRRGTPGANNYPLRGGKASNFDGGIRVPALVSGGWVPHQMRGAKLDGLVALWDLYATFAAVAGVANVSDVRAAAAGTPPVDGVDQSAYLRGESPLPPRRTLTIGDVGGDHAIWAGPNAAVTGVIVDEGGSGLWKMLVGSVPMATWTGPQSPNASFSWLGHVSPEQQWLECGGRGCLWRLDADPTEHHDVAAVPENEARLAEMLAIVEGEAATVFSPAAYSGAPDAGACEAARNRWNGTWGPWVDLH
jgi:arylsulfatase B